MSDSRLQEPSRKQPEQLLGAKRPDTLQNNLFVKNIGNRSSLRMAINAQCAHCMGCTADHMEPDYRNSIRNCTSNQCPLWHFRPYREKSV